MRAITPTTRTIATLLCALLGSTLSSAQQDSAHMRGRVVKSDGQAFPGAEVRVRQGDSESTRRTTNAKGDYVVDVPRNLVDGALLIVDNHDGFSRNPHKQEITDPSRPQRDAILVAPIANQQQAAAFAKQVLSIADGSSRSAVISVVASLPQQTRRLVENELERDAGGKGVLAELAAAKDEQANAKQP